MPIGGPSYTPNDPEKQARVREEMDRLREYSIEELSELLTEGEILDANRHHLSNSIPELLNNPVPPQLKKANELGCIALTNNVLDFDEVLPGTEKLIDKDEKMMEIYDLPNDSRRAPLLRARRSILGYLLITGANSESDVA